MSYFGTGWSYGHPMGDGWRQVTSPHYDEQTDYQREVERARDYVKYSGDLRADLSDPSAVSSRALATIVHDKNMDDARKDIVREAYAERGMYKSPEEGGFTERDRMYEHVAIFQNVAESLGHNTEVWLNEDDESIEIHYWDENRYPHDFRLGPEDGLEISMPPSLGGSRGVLESADEMDPDWRYDDRNYPELNAVVDALAYATQNAAVAERNYRESHFGASKDGSGSENGKTPSRVLSEEERAALRDRYVTDGRAETDASFAAEDMRGKFTSFLFDIGCRESWRSEWDYASPHSGIQAEVDPVQGHISPEPIDAAWMNDESTGCEEDIAQAWEPHRKRIAELQGRMDSGQRELDELDRKFGGYYNSMSDAEQDRLHAKAEKIEEELNRLEDELYDEEAEALRDVCKAYEESLKKTYDYFYSDEAADEWIDGLVPWELEEELAVIEPREEGILSRFGNVVSSRIQGVRDGAKKAAQRPSNPFGGDATVSSGKGHEGKPMVDGYEYVNKNGKVVHVDSYKNPRYKGPRR